MKKILIATDFSPAAMNAAKYAADMALAIDAGLLLLHVYQAPVIYSEVPVAVNTEEMLSDANKEIIRIKNEISNQLNKKISIETEVREGVFFSELEKVCEKINPYTVVMGCQGTTAAERLILGGHAIHAAKYLNWPLITVPVNVKFSMIKKIGFACDFDNVIETVPVDEIKNLMKDFKAELHILNTGKKTEFNPDTVFQSGMLQEMMEGVKPNYHFITNSNIDEGIIEFAEQNNIDLLIVLPKRHGFIDKLIHKSHTKQLVLHSHVPVMALH